MKKINFILFILLAGFAVLSAQETKKEQTTPEPFDLPNFIIQGNLQLNVNSGIKQDPERPRPLKANELDSLNSLEKQNSQSLPVEPLITNTIHREFNEGFVKAQFGRFSTAQINAGYGIDLDGYDIYGQAGFETSNGHVNNADFSKFNAKITSDYVAPPKYFIFGGSRTRTEIEFRKNDYNLYGNPLGLDRSLNNFSAKVDVDGKYNNFKFETGAGFNGLQIVTNDFKNADNNIFGYLKVHNIWNNFLVAGNVLIDMHTLRGKATNFMQADGSISIFSNSISLSGNAGIQLAANSNGVDRGGLLIAGQIEYRMSKLFTIRGDIRSGLENKSFREMAYSNPYISNMADFDYAYDIMNLGGTFIFHPNEYIGISGGIRVRSTDRFPVFAPDVLYYPGSFNLRYESISLFQTMFEGYWYISSDDKLIAGLTASQSSLSDFDNSSIPYVPNLKLSADYKKSWMPEFGTDIGIDYIGERFADVQNTVKLDSYINVRLEGKYNFSNGPGLFLRFDNLLNSDIFVWEGYKERNVFISFGIIWQF